MSDKIPSLAETCELHWALLFDDVRKAGKNGPIYVSLETKPIEDGIEKELVLGKDNLPEEAPKYPIDIFWFSILGDVEYCPTYLGGAKRIPDEDSTRFSYSDDALSQLRHEAGLRLGRLKNLGRDVYFTCITLGYDKKEVTEEFAASLLNSDRISLSIVKEKLI